MMAVSLSCDSATYAAIVGGALGALHGPWSADWTQTLDQTTLPGFAATAGEIIESAIGSWM